MDNQQAVWSQNTIRCNADSVQNVATDGTMIADVSGARVSVANYSATLNTAQYAQPVTTSEPLFGNNIREAVRILRSWIGHA